MRETGGLILRNDGGTAYNKAYLASCLRHFAQILLRRTSDTLGTLSEEFTNLILKQKGNFYHPKLTEKAAR